jgi:nitroimidazol reductase NimA-like FMN-containing flavoprotein (pyridoxamine 5'-phosphate oxidase superfamily)
MGENEDLKSSNPPSPTLLSCARRLAPRDAFKDPSGLAAPVTLLPMTDQSVGPQRDLKAIVDSNLYMVLGTADADGRPWATPVYYAVDDYRDFIWVSAPETQHSRNMGSRPDISIVIFDSSAPISTGRGVYMRATAAEVVGDERLSPIEVFSKRAIGHGGRPWSLADVISPARLRLYRASVVERFISGEGDRRIPVDL